jgi:ubiquitin-conjugating enzyme E2 S
VLVSLLIYSLIITAGTPFAGGTFRIKLCLGKDFPMGPPKAYFITKVFHPNVAKNGEICVNSLKKDWKPDLGIKHILLVSVQCFSSLNTLPYH